MQHDLIHIQGKSYVLVPLHEYRQMMSAPQDVSLPEDVLNRIAEKRETPVKVLRKFRGLTQDELAGAAGISRPYLTEIETGRKDGSIRAIKALAGALQVKTDLLTA